MLLLRLCTPLRRRGWCLRLLLLMMMVAAPTLSAAAPGAATLVGQVDQVADGDTLTIVVDGNRQRIRLHQIDAPEHDQPGSSAARRALSRKVSGRYVRVAVETVDDYGRIVGGVRLGNRDINREMVEEGHAWAYRQYLEDRSLLAAEAAARKAKRGLWARADPVPPWDWRHAGRPAARSHGAAGDCRIKGNVNRRGERIYHLPGSRFYAQTRISTARGERWFCSAEEAERAGWRAPR